jgi:hypothetical protein
MRSTRLAWALLTLGLFTLYPDNTEAREQYRRQGSSSARIGLGAFAVRTVSTDGQGNATDEGTSLGLSLLGGLSWAAHPRLVLDGDLELFFALTPQLDLIQTELTPGARLFITPRFYARGAYAVRLLAPENQLFLMGAGYYISRSDLSVFVELNYVLWSEQEVKPPLVPRFGVELRF